MHTQFAPPAHDDQLPSGAVLEQLLVQLPVGVMICDHAGTLVYANAAARRVRDEMRAPRPEVASPYERFERMLASTLLTAECVRGELVPFVGPDAETGWLAATVTPVYDGHVVTGCVLTFSDATARRRLRALTRTLDSLRRL